LKERLDSYRHKGLRKKLLEVLFSKNIQDKNILEAFDKTPRHLFLDKAFEEQAYEDKAFPIDAEQTISQPYTVARQTQLLELKPTDKVLEIGTGSGFQACILAHLGAEVYSIERHEILHKKAKTMFRMLDLKIHAFLQDGHIGLKEHAPFDKIIFTAGATEAPQELLMQLKIGGYCLIPIGETEQIMTRFKRISDTKFEKEEFGNFRFVPFLKGIVPNHN